MDKCREAFEQIPEIKKRLFYVSFDEKSQNYHPKRYSLDFGFLRLNFVQGAWLVWQSRQAEFVDKDQRIHELNETSLDLEGQIYKLQEQLNEKDKRIESALYALKGLKAENDLWGCDQVEVQIEILEKALRGEHEA